MPGTYPLRTIYRKQQPLKRPPPTNYFECLWNLHHNGYCKFEDCHHYESHDRMSYLMGVVIPNRRRLHDGYFTTPTVSTGDLHPPPQQEMFGDINHLLPSYPNTTPTVSATTTATIHATTAPWRIDGTTTYHMKDSLPSPQAQLIRQFHSSLQIRNGSWGRQFLFFPLAKAASSSTTQSYQTIMHRNGYLRVSTLSSLRYHSTSLKVKALLRTETNQLVQGATIQSTSGGTITENTVRRADGVNTSSNNDDETIDDDHTTKMKDKTTTMTTKQQQHNNHNVVGVNGKAISGFGDSPQSASFSSDTPINDGSDGGFMPSGSEFFTHSGTPGSTDGSGGGDNDNNGGGGGDDDDDEYDDHTSNTDTPAKNDTNHRQKKAPLKKSTKTYDRRKLLRNRRKQRVEETQRMMEEELLADRQWTEWIPRDSIEFEQLFDRLVTRYAPYKLMDAVREIHSGIGDHGRKRKNEVDSLLALQKMLHSTSPMRAEKITILSFLLAEEPSQQLHRGTAPTWKNSSPAGNIPRRGIDKDESERNRYASVMYDARSRALREPIFWDKADEQEFLALTAEERDRILKARTTIHWLKPSNDMKQEANELVDYLQKVLPSRVFRSVMNVFEYYATDNPRWLRKESVGTTLNEMLGKTLPSHLHLVAERIDDFLYASQAFGGCVADQASVNRSTKQWQSSKNDFVHVLMEVQTKLMRSVETNAQLLEGRLPSNDALDEDAETDASLRGSHGQNLIRDRRHRSPRHVKFGATIVQHTETPSPRNVPENVVFIDNLPIDISRDELRDLYSRCGSIEAIEIFNLRPELDPGNLSILQQKERRKAKISEASIRKWERPRTPVYGMIQFTYPNGKQRALDTALKAFGMMIRRHPARSIDAAKMLTLYLENIPGDVLVNCAELETMVRTALQPEVLVTLDAGQNKQWIAGSCEISFPSFEVAFEAMDRLRKLEFVSEKSCVINWMRTPLTAEQWWKREIGFD